MLKFHFTFNKEEMAGWLDKMDREGWQLRRTAAGFCTFDRVAPGTYDYQIDYRGPGVQPDPAYSDFMADMGVDVVCRWGPWVVLRRPAAEGPFELYTDAASRAQHLGSVLRFFKIMCILEFAACLMLLTAAAETGEWWMYIVCAVGFAAAAGMAARIIQLRREMGDRAGRGIWASDPALRWLAIAGTLCLCSSPLIAWTTSNEAGPAFLRGVGIGLCVVALVRGFSHGYGSD